MLVVAGLMSSPWPAAVPELPGAGLVDKDVLDADVDSMDPLFMDEPSGVFFELGVMVKADALSGLLERPERSVKPSLPSCDAVPSLSS